MTEEITIRRKDLLKLQINNKIFERHTVELKEVLAALEVENKKKKYLLEFIKKGNKRNIQDQDEEMHEVKNCCKLNDLRLKIEQLDPRISEDDLKEHFDTFGEVIDVYIEKSEISSSGFITFSYFFEERPGRQQVLKNIPMTVEHVSSIDNKGVNQTIVITGGADVSELSGNDFRKYFSCIGEITDFRRTVNHKTNKLSRFVFIEFDSPRDVEKVLVKRNHKISNVDVSVFNY